MSREFILKTNRNNNLRVSVFGLNNIAFAPCLILVHGFKGFKDWGFWNYSANLLAENGFCVLTFNFSHNGIGDEPLNFTELDKFANNTISLEISELSELIEFYKSGFFGNTSNSKIGLVGHSRGGAVSILTSSKIDSVSALVVWASISEFRRYTSRQITEWRKSGVLEVVNSRTKQIMRISVSLLEDIEKNSEGSLNIEKAVRLLRKPFLIVHGEQDLTVPVKEAYQLFKWSDKNISELEIIPAAGHTFNITHPFNGSNDQFDKVLNKTLNFFKNNLFKENNDD
jgi:uncharacterized protein